MNNALVEEATLMMIRDRLSKKFDIVRIVLFGSRARGEASPDSDYDVLVVAQTDVPFVERQGLALLALGKRDFAVDLLMYTPAEAEREAKILGSTLFWAEREGKVVYAK